MFYSTQILARRGPLGMVWMAAHMHEQLKRNQVSGMSLVVAVDALLHPETPLALRLSGQLLLGLVRLYSKQLGYLHQDCQDALVRLQLAFHQAAKQGGGGLHTLPDPGERPAGPGADLLLDGDGGWGDMVDMMEAQLLHMQPGMGTGGTWQLDDMLTRAGEEEHMPLRALSMGPSASLLNQMQLSAATPGGRRKAGSKAGAKGPGQQVLGSDTDVQLMRDQGARRGAQTPSLSRLGSQAESLFAAVASSAAARTSGPRTGGNPSAAGPVLLPMHGDVLLMNEDEVFDAHPGDDVAPLDLLGHVEVEVLRDAPSSAAHRMRHASQLLGDLGHIDSATRRLIMGPQAAQDTPSTAHANKAGGPSLRRMADMDADDLGMAGSHRSHQGSRGGSGGLLLPSGLDPPLGTPSSGLLDMEIDLATLMGVGPGSQAEAGSAMQLLATHRLHAGSPEGGHASTGVPVPPVHQQDSAGGVSPAGGARVGQGTPQSMAGQHAAGGPARKRASARLQELLQASPALGPRPVPDQVDAQAKVQARAGRRQQAVHLARGQTGDGSHWRVGVLKGLPPRAPQLMDLAEAGSRRSKGADPTLVKAADCRALLSDTSALQVERGLAAYRRSKRARVMQGHVRAGGRTLEERLAQPALQAAWRPAFLQAVQQRTAPAQSPLPPGDRDPVAAGTGVAAHAGVGTQPSPHHSLPQPAPQAGTEAARQSPAPWPVPGPGMSPDGAMLPPPGPAPSVGDMLPASTGRHALQAIQPTTIMTAQAAPPLKPPTVPEPFTHPSANGDSENHAPPASQALSAPPRPSTSLPQAAAHGPSPASQILCPWALAQDPAPPGPALPGSVQASAAHAHAASPSHGLGLGSQLAPRDMRIPASQGRHPLGSQTPACPSALRPGQAQPAMGQSDDGVSGWPELGMQAALRSGSGPSSGQSGRSGHTQLEHRATRTLCELTRLTATGLPQELQSQVLSQAWALPSRPLPSEPGEDGSPAALPSQSQAIQQPSSQRNVQLTQGEVIAGLAACEPLQMGELVASQQLGGTQAPGARLHASRCFYDLLVLQSRGLVSLSQAPPAPSQAPGVTQPTQPTGHPGSAASLQGGPSSELQIRITQLGASQLLG